MIYVFPIENMPFQESLEAFNFFSKVKGNSFGAFQKF